MDNIEEIVDSNENNVQSISLNLSPTSATSEISKAPPEKEAQVEAPPEKNNEEDLGEEMEAQLGTNNEEDLGEEMEVQLGTNNEEDLGEQMEAQLGTNNSDLLIDITSNRYVDFGESIKIGNYLLHGIVHSFPHGIGIKNIYFHVSFGDKNIQFGDLCSDGFFLLVQQKFLLKSFSIFQSLLMTTIFFASTLKNSSAKIVLLKQQINSYLIMERKQKIILLWKQR
jgi:hypothetical protein